MLTLILACAGRATPSDPTPLDPIDAATGDTGGLTTATGDTAAVPLPADSVCAETADHRICPHQTLPIATASGPRDVHLQQPAGAAPADGWPVVVLFQGSFYSAAWMWEARPSDPFGAWNQTGAIAALLDAGYAVLTPEALGGTFWTTNIPPYNLLWTTSPDHALMQALFTAVDDAPDLDGGRLYAAGISSGGYMTSRMAEAYPGRFRALAVHSASWATCGGAACLVPNRLPADHPPTLFLHGEDDLVAPLWAMQLYADGLQQQGTPVRVTTDPGAGHAWIDAAPAELVAWFDAH